MKRVGFMDDPDSDGPRADRMILHMVDGRRLDHIIDSRVPSLTVRAAIARLAPHTPYRDEAAPG